MRRITSAFFAIALLACGTAHAAIDVFLCIPPIVGESTDAAFNDCIDTTFGSEAAFLEAGEAEPRDVRFGKFFDSTSGPLRRGFVNGTVWDSATFYLRRAGQTGGNPAYAHIKLIHARLTSMATTFNSGDDFPAESLSLTGERIEYMHRKQSQAGALQPPTYVCWDIALQTATNAQCPP